MDRTEAKVFCQEIIDLYNLPNVKLRMVDNTHGYANYGTRVLAIPLWAFSLSAKGYGSREYPIEFRYAYVLHEISHFINIDSGGQYGHQGTFRTAERKLLAEFGLIPVYSRAYIKQLKTENGSVVYARMKRGIK
ncbi:hypothetical protein LCGC14_0360470 [marine sediment metagenome]|uniref:Lysine-specific metallo-endopeptidase domain-containing protein n=1 Tax=marine sediment metagenome TaxID=412755 RepID=A0A0F9WGK2_9ZZZZ|nr:hypothetical protein [bacterium]